MSFDPLLDAPVVVQVHAFAAMAGFILGAIQLLAPKGTLPHRTLGFIWVAIMIVVGVSSAFIYRPIESGDPFWARFSPIHIFTIVTAVAIVQGGWFLLKGGPTLKFHSRPFIGLFIGGLVVAGILAFLPGRIMHQVAFGG